jgi:hypothetical protein
MRDMTDPDAGAGIGDAAASPGDEDRRDAGRTRPPHQLDWHDRIAVAALGDGSWRICDRTKPEDDAHHVVAYAERSGDDIEAIWVHGSHSRTTFTTVDQVAHAAYLGLLRIATERRRPIPIFHLPPVTGRRPRRRTSGRDGDPRQEGAHE